MLQESFRDIADALGAIDPAKATLNFYLAWLRHWAFEAYYRIDKLELDAEG